EIRALQRRAASDLRSVASYTALLIAQDISDPSGRRPGVLGPRSEARRSARLAADRARTARGDAPQARDWSSRGDAQCLELRGARDRRGGSVVCEAPWLSRAPRFRR